MQGFIDQVQVDYVVNGIPEGQLAGDIMSGRYSMEDRVRFDPGLLRPVIQKDGQRYLAVHTGRMVANKQGTHSYNPNVANGEEVPERRYVPLQRLVLNGVVPPTYNASALPYHTWMRIDRAVIKASREKLRAWDDLAAANTYGGFDGMGVTAVVRDTVVDYGKAIVEMDTKTQDYGDRPLYTPDIVPLPVIHSGVSIGQRQLAQSRNSGMPLDTSGIEQCGRRCAETLEDMTTGNVNYSSLTIGSSTDFTRRGIYGFKTQPDRITYSITGSASWTDDPTGGPVLVQEIIDMVEEAALKNFTGPFVLYYGRNWNKYFKRDYWAVKTSGGAAPTKTVLQRVMEIEEIQAVRQLERHTSSDDLILVQMTSETVRAIVGLEFMTVQWTIDGGATSMLRVMGIKVPELRSQHIGTDATAANRKCGIVHGS